MAALRQDERKAWTTISSTTILITAETARTVLRIVPRTAPEIRRIRTTRTTRITRTITRTTDRTTRITSSRFGTVGGDTFGVPVYILGKIRYTCSQEIVVRYLCADLS